MSEGRGRGKEKGGRMGGKGEDTKGKEDWER